MDSDLFDRLKRPRKAYCVNCGQRFGLAIFAYWLTQHIIPCTGEHEWKER